jgi:RsiW-degrading membrane proteinase PrsW (M82 family)
MSSRGPLGWYLGLIALIVVAMVIVVVQLWFASGQQIAVNDFYESQQGGLVTDEEYRYWDSMMRDAYQLVTVVAPTLLTGAVAALVALLALLAFRWERRRRTPTEQATR